MSLEDFFDYQKPQSRLKSQIVSRFFEKWSSVMSGYLQKKRLPVALAYVDIFAGPGRYRKDGQESTPLLIARQVIGSNILRGDTLLVLNEVNPSYLAELKQNLVSLPGIETLGRKLEFSEDEVTATYRGFLRPIGSRPTLFFFDPFGWKVIVLDLLRAAVQGFGRDVIFFFNYRRVNMAVSNPVFDAHVKELLGSRADATRDQVRGLPPSERETVVVDAITEELKQSVAQFITKFRFADEGDEASHYLFFASKHVKGMQLMASIMNEFSQKDAPSASSEFGVVPERSNGQKMIPGFAASRTPPLPDTLLSHFRGSRHTVLDVYKQYCSGKPITLPQCKNALKELEARGDVRMTPAAADRRPNTLADHVIVEFTRVEGGRG